MMQTEPADNIMQETCVTVTWIRVMARMYLLTKDAKYIDRIEQSGYNALYGSLNTKSCKQLELVSREYLEPKNSLKIKYGGHSAPTGSVSSYSTHGLAGAAG